MKARVHISLKPEVLDPQGKAIGNALKGLGFDSVGEVRQGKLIELELADSDPAAEQQECVNKAKALFRAAEEARRFASTAERGQ